jgi:hypothetical protein
VTIKKKYNIVVKPKLKSKNKNTAAAAAAAATTTMTTTRTLSTYIPKPYRSEYKVCPKRFHVSASRIILCVTKDAVHSPT